LPSDAVFVSFARGGGTAAGEAQRIWVMPFEKGLGGGAAALWTNSGVGVKQTKLLRLDPKYGVKDFVKVTEGGYEVTVAIPRKLLFAGGEECVMDIGVQDNDRGARTWVRSWAQESGGPAVWGRVRVSAAETRPAATGPATMRGAATGPKGREGG